MDIVVFILLVILVIIISIPIGILLIKTINGMNSIGESLINMQEKIEDMIESINKM